VIAVAGKVRWCEGYGNCPNFDVLWLIGNAPAELSAALGSAREQDMVRMGWGEIGKFIGGWRWWAPARGGGGDTPPGSRRNHPEVRAGLAIVIVLVEMESGCLDQVYRHL